MAHFLHLERMESFYKNMSACAIGSYSLGSYPTGCKIQDLRSDMEHQRIKVLADRNCQIILLNYMYSIILKLPQFPDV